MSRKNAVSTHQSSVSSVPITVSSTSVGNSQSLSRIAGQSVRIAPVSETVTATESASTHGVPPFVRTASRLSAELVMATSYLHDDAKERPFKCSLCNKAFRDKCNLNAHQRTHTGTVSYRCEICEMLFTRQSSLRRHQRRKHHGVREADSLKKTIPSPSLSREVTEAFEAHIPSGRISSSNSTVGLSSPLPGLQGNTQGMSAQAQQGVQDEPDQVVEVKEEVGCQLFGQNQWDNNRPLWQGIYADIPDGPTKTLFSVARIPRKHWPRLRRNIDCYKAYSVEKRASHLSKYMKQQICDGTDIPALKGKRGVFAKCDIEPYTQVGHFSAMPMHNTQYNQGAVATGQTALTIDTFSFYVSDEMLLSGFNHGNITTEINANTTHEPGLAVPYKANVKFIAHYDNGRLLPILVTCKPIFKGDQLLYDYGTSFWRKQREPIDLTVMDCSDDDMVAAVRCPEEMARSQLPDNSSQSLSCEIPVNPASESMDRGAALNSPAFGEIALDRVVAPSIEGVPKTARQTSRTNIHNAEKPFKCDLCDKCLSSNSSLMRHKAIIHSKLSTINSALMPSGQSLQAEMLGVDPLFPSQDVGARALAKTSLGDDFIIPRNTTEAIAESCEGIVKERQDIVVSKTASSTRSAQPRGSELQVHSSGAISHDNVWSLILAQPSESATRVSRASKSGSVLTTQKKKTESERVNLMRVYGSKDQRFQYHDTAIAAYKCGICSKVFTNIDNLNRHKFTHTGKTSYECDLSNQAFARKDVLYGHQEHVRSTERITESLNETVTTFALESSATVRLQDNVPQGCQEPTDLMSSAQSVMTETPLFLPQVTASNALGKTTSADASITPCDISEMTTESYEGMVGTRQEMVVSPDLVVELYSITQSDKTIASEAATTHQSTLTNTIAAREEMNAVQESEKKQFLCRTCDKTFVGYDQLRRHYATFHKKTMCYQCEFCKRFLKKPIGLKFHQQRKKSCIRLAECMKKRASSFTESRALIDESQTLLLNSQAPAASANFLSMPVLSHQYTVPAFTNQTSTSFFLPQSMVAIGQPSIPNLFVAIPSQPHIPLAFTEAQNNAAPDYINVHNDEELLISLFPENND